MLTNRVTMRIHSSLSFVKNVVSRSRSRPYTLLLVILVVYFATGGHLWSLLTPEQCVPAEPMDTVTDRLNALLSASGAAGYSLKLCPNTQYLITSPIKFAWPNQEITTLGFPGDDMALEERAIIKVDGIIRNGTGQTTAVDGRCDTCQGAKLRYVQVDGNRNGEVLTLGSASIEMGGNNRDQVVEHVRSFDPRSWSCLHIAEGDRPCSNTLIQHNDIGPCGTDKFEQWADGISLSCKDSTVRNNIVTGATDGGIVVFGSPGSRIYNNTIIAKYHTLLGGINLVDYDPWDGDYTDTVVQDNHIVGGFATIRPGDYYHRHRGRARKGPFIKIGIAMGPRTWFGDKYGMNETRGAVVRNNDFRGAIGYALAAATVNNFTVSGNTILPDTGFVGSRGPNCSSIIVVPPPQAFLFNSSQVLNSELQFGFVNGDTDALTCIFPDKNDIWPHALHIASPIIPPVSNHSNLSNATLVATHDTKWGSNVSTVVLLSFACGAISALAVSIVARWWYTGRIDLHNGVHRDVKK